jgi:hypothetical protein
MRLPIGVAEPRTPNLRKKLGAGLCKTATRFDTPRRILFTEINERRPSLRTRGSTFLNLFSIVSTSTSGLQQDPICPECGCKHTVKKGKRRNRFQTLQVYRCTECLHLSPARQEKTRRIRCD